MQAALTRRRFAAITTCHAAGYTGYGQRMAETFVAHWPADVPLLLYSEGFAAVPVTSRVIERDLLACCPDLVAFKQRHANNPRAHGQRKPWRRLKLGRFWLPLPVRTNKAQYRWDAVRFAHKAFAIFHAARHSDADVLIWIDADTLFFAPVDHVELAALAPADAALSCLRRPNHSECGFVAYNLRHPGMAAFMAEFEQFYTHDTLFAEREYHDSYLFDVARRHAEALGTPVHDIGEGIGWRASHVLINSRLGRFMDHMKGGRKSEGHSRADDLVAARPEAYWQAQK